MQIDWWKVLGLFLASVAALIMWPAIFFCGLWSLMILLHHPWIGFVVVALFAFCNIFIYKTDSVEK